jgi:hypothetical protein
VKLGAGLQPAVSASENDVVHALEVPFLLSLFLTPDGFALLIVWSLVQDCRKLHWQVWQVNGGCWVISACLSAQDQA